MAKGVSKEIARNVFKKLLGFAARESQGARGGVRGAGLPVVLAEVLLPGRVHLRPAEQPADGLLPAPRFDERRQAHGLRIFGPDINLSQLRCSVEGNAIRIGIGYVQHGRGDRNESCWSG